jgi:hypothetical protein
MLDTKAVLSASHVVYNGEKQFQHWIRLILYDGSHVESGYVEGPNEKVDLSYNGIIYFTEGAEEPIWAAFIVSNSPTIEVDTPED